MSNVILSTYFMVKIIDAVVADRIGGTPTKSTQNSLKALFHI